MVKISGPPDSAKRNKPIGRELEEILRAAARDVGIDAIFITSGSQPGTRGLSTGSTRHNGGRAADVQLIVNGQTQTFTNSSGGSVVAPFITAVAAYGATGIGAATDYMGNRTIHVGFGVDESDTSKLVWGRKGRSANAPAWLRTAASAGWNTPRSLEDEEDGFDPNLIDLPATFVVAARSGLNLRKAADLDAGISSVLPSGTVVTVVDFKGTEDDWALVDLEGDGQVDGFLYSAFLAPLVDMADADEDVDEPGIA